MTPPEDASVLVACRDLLSSSQLTAAVRAAHHRPVAVDGVEAVLREVQGAVALVVDLGDPGGGTEVVAAARIARADLPIIAVGPHVDSALLGAARQAGASHVLTHGVVRERLPRILADIEPQLPPPGPGDGPPTPRRPVREPPDGPTGKHA